MVVIKQFSAPHRPSDYVDILGQMQHFTQERTSETVDEIWHGEHAPVFTLGQRAVREYILDPGDIPVVHSDRGGHVTYHGPGQSIFYPLLDLKRTGLGIKNLLFCLEETVLKLLTVWEISGGHRIAQAPGVYVENKKIASIGLRVKKHCSYHGLSLNVHMNMDPFKRIIPCGIAGLSMCQLSDFIPTLRPDIVEATFLTTFLTLLEEHL